MALRLGVRCQRDDLTVPCLAHVLTVVGGLAEIGGLIVVVVEIVKVQRREIPEHRGWVVRSLAAMREAGQGIADEVGRLLRREPERRDATIHAAVMGGSATAGGGGVTATVTTGPAPTLAERVERLERDYQSLAEQSVRDRDKINAGLRASRQRTEEVDREIRAMIEERDRKRREGVRDALTLQKLGTALFVVGVGLSVWGNLAPC